jgi:glycerophosphoryl diester phosphodiesterase
MNKTTIRPLLTLSILLCTLLLLPACVQTKMNPLPTQGAQTQPLLIGHRGASWYAPENTVASVKKAYELGADAAEIDVHLTLDHQVVVIHDANTSATTGIHFVVRETPLEEIRKLDAGSWKGPEFAGEKIPLLSEVLDIVPPGKLLVIEIKSGPHVVPAMVEVVKKSGKADQVIFISFTMESLELAGELMPEVPRSWLLSARKEGDSYYPIKLETVQLAKDKGFQGINVNSGGLSPEVIEEAHRLGMPVYTWTINYPDWVEKLTAWGVDGITTDKIPMTIETLN